MNKKILGFILIIMIITIGINSEYVVSKARSKIINSSIEEGAIIYSQQNTVPLVLLHGFNPVYSKRLAEFSLIKMQEKISGDLGYINKGLLTEDTSCLELISKDKPIVIRASYLNGIKDPDIKSYSNEVDQIINKVMKCTGSEKVDVITHSMGGIVMRYYLKDLEEKPVRKLIMVATPNNGGLYNLSDFIELFSDEEEVNIDFLQLSENSGFMKKLNEKKSLDGVEYYTIAGKIDEIGDGIIAESSTRLEMNHFVVECNHVTIKNPSLCPESYLIIKEILS